MKDEVILLKAIIWGGLLILVPLVIFISLDAFAPANHSLTVLRTEPINPFERILKAISDVESNNGTNLFNSKENAVGYFGIRPIRLLDYNLRTGKNITLDQCYDYETGKMIFLFFACKFNPNDYECIAKDWNKSRTDKYWNKVKAKL
jgi:hypothetical protein